MGAVSCEHCLSLLSDLCSTSAELQSQLEQALKDRIKAVRKRILNGNNFINILDSFFCPNYSTDDLDQLDGQKVTELFVEWILFLLKVYSEALAKELEEYKVSAKQSKKVTCSPDVLSVQQLKYFKCSLDFVFVLGICPQLQPGLGLPMDVKYFSYKNVQEHFPFLVNTARDDDRLKQLIDRVIKLYEFKASTIFKDYITSHHFNGYVSALLQLAFCPPNKECLKITSNFNDAAARNDLILKYKRYLEDLIYRLPKTFVFKELLYFVAKHPNSLFESPSWSMKVCNIFIRECLMRPEGVKSFVFSLIQECSDSMMGVNGQQVADSPGTIESIAVLIVNRPLFKCPPQQYFSVILNQIVEIIKECNQDDKKISESNKFLMMSSMKILNCISHLHPSFFETYFLSVFIKPLILCTLPVTPDQSKEIVSEKDFSYCIHILYKLLIVFHIPNSNLSSWLAPYMDVIFNVYFYSDSGPTYLSSLIKSIVLQVFSAIESDNVIWLLKYFSGLEKFDSFSLSSSSSSLTDLHLMNQNLHFVPGSSGGVKVVMKNSNERGLIDGREITLKTIDRKVLCIMEILSSIKDESILIAIFLTCLQELTRVVTEEMESESDSIRMISSVESFDSDDWSRSLTLLTLLQSFIEKFNNLCLTNAEHIFTFCKATMERSINIWKKTKSSRVCVESVEDLQDEPLSLAIGLLATVVFDEKQMSASSWSQAEELIPSLRYLSDNHLSQEVRVVSYELMEAIATHRKLLKSCSNVKGDVLNHTKKKSFSTSVPSSSVDLKQDSKICSASLETDVNYSIKDCQSAGSSSSSLLNQTTKSSSSCTNSSNFAEKKENLTKGKVLIEEISTTETSYYEDVNDLLKSLCHSSPGSGENQDEILKTFRPQTAFQQMLIDVTSFMVPVKGHGLLQLKKLIQSSDAEVEKNTNLVLKICGACLCHEDSYVYLPAIDSLSSMAASHPDAFSVLMENYGKKQKSPEIKLKLGEALVKAVRSFGEMIVIHKNKLFATFLTVSRDEDASIRSSAISNLAEVCKLLRFSLSSCLYEIFESIRTILKYEKNTEVRRAAALFTTQLLRGTSKDTLMILGDLLVDFYRLLKEIDFIDCDPVVKLHIQLSCEELKNIMTGYLFPQPSFKKDIFILNPPRH